MIYYIRMRLLELFSGTGSVGNIARGLGWDVTSLDRDMKANIMCDIQDWDYEADEGHYDFIWASPPCTEYSCAKNNRGKGFGWGRRYGDTHTTDHTPL